MTKELQEKLNEIQVGLVANKSKRNAFGNYNYRSAEDILEALKPHLKKTGCVVNITDDIVLVSDRIYVKSTASLVYGVDEISAVAFAREPLAKKGTDDSQVTGATTSYARKYALCGLFAIDDGIDADTTNMHGSANGKKDAVAALNKCKTEKELQDAWNYYGPSFGNDEDFRTAYMVRLSAIQNGTK